ncbi:MAG: NAD(+) synthase [Oscillospiraceae bacterium]|nr:NAD(+) synthase [Oscillospiraceae bacterium]
MNLGFIKVSSACPMTDISNVDFNLMHIKNCIDMALNEGSKVIVFPELSITSYTCGDLFLNSHLIDKSYDTILELVEYSKDKDIFIVVGSPIKYKSELFNCAVCILNGEILGVVPKSYIPNYGEFYEKRWFSSGGNILNRLVDINIIKSIPFGKNIVFNYKSASIGIELCEDVWTIIPPSSFLTRGGANIILNLSASNDIVGKHTERENLVKAQSARSICAYVYSSCGVHESTTDIVFSGALIISELGKIIAENKRFEREDNIISTCLDLDRIENERLRNKSFKNDIFSDFEILNIDFEFKNDFDLKYFNKKISPNPFLPKDEGEIDSRCDEIFNIQTAGLAKRLEKTKINRAVLGISGGLDSTLALLTVIKTFDMLKYERKNIITITMPGFGTTDRTYLNAVNLCRKLNCDFREISITKSILEHFKDIGHDENIHDVTYENAQARERTQILMDIANKENGIVIGTGDLSESALGWCTYNGDHMSMYNVNTSIPKTLVRYLVDHIKNKLYESQKEISDLLGDILETPISPELLPKDENGNIMQKTEDKLGSYELHDFFIFHFIRHGFSPEKIIFLANECFKDKFSEEYINDTFKTFTKRFFTQSFKRSCSPDGPKVGSISLSPRGDFRMASDADFSIWINSVH